MSDTTRGDAAVTHTVAQNPGLRSRSPVDPPLAIELEEMTRTREREVVLLADVRERHARRKAVTEPHPVFPTTDPAA